MKATLHPIRRIWYGESRRLKLISLGRDLELNNSGNSIDLYTVRCSKFGHTVNGRLFHPDFFGTDDPRVCGYLLSGDFPSASIWIYSSHQQPT